MPWCVWEGISRKKKSQEEKPLCESAWDYPTNWGPKLEKKKKGGKWKSQWCRHHLDAFWHREWISSAPPAMMDDIFPLLDFS